MKASYFAQPKERILVFSCSLIVLWTLLHVLPIWYFSLPSHDTNWLLYVYAAGTIISLIFLYSKKFLKHIKQAAILSYEKQPCLGCLEAVTKERERIYQDIHDGIGSRLVTTLFSIRQAMPSSVALEAQLQSCLDDLRLVVNTRMDENKDIQSAIFEYCLSLEMQLEGSGLTLEYEVTDGAAIHLPLNTHVNILRILQESLANVIKHSRATFVFVKFSKTDTAMTLSVIDNGIGFPPALGVISHHSPHRIGGRGLPGVAARAKSMNGSCAINALNPGTEIAVTIPFPSLIQMA